MIAVFGKIQSVRPSRSGKSVSLNVGGTWVNVNKDDLETLKNVIGKGDPIPVRARTDLSLDEDGKPVMRTFVKRDKTTGSGPDIRVRYWANFASAQQTPEELKGLLDLEVEPGAKASDED
jgi:hypothetical protein